MGYFCRGVLHRGNPRVIDRVQNMIFPDILTIEETANYLRLPKETIERQALQGQIPGKYIGNSLRFFRSAIDEWLRGNETQVTFQNDTNGDAQELKTLYP